MKQAIVVRTDLTMSTGKLAVQACHASVAGALSASQHDLKCWKLDGQKKVVLGIPSLSELDELKTRCEELGVIHALIADAGRTELTSGTITALAVGPASDKLVDRVVGSVPLLK